MEYFITLQDYLLLPIFVGIIYMIAYRFRDRHYPPGHPWRIYFIPALTAKVVGAILIGLIYQFYYKGGDTAEYFKQARIINSAFLDSPAKWFNLIFHIPDSTQSGYEAYKLDLEGGVYWYNAPSEYWVIVITAIIGLVSFTSYLPIAVLFAGIAFTGVWALFRTFAQQYPKLVRPIAVVTLFIPTTILWGSGVFKDTICLGCIGWLTYGVFRMLLKRDFTFRNLIFTVISFIWVGNIKIYILMAFIPALTLWILFNYMKRVRLAVVRWLMVLGFLGIIAIGFNALSARLETTFGKYSLANISVTAAATAGWIKQTSQDQSAVYDLGPLDFSLSGLAKKLPAAVNVTLYRPYLWETRKIFQFLTAIESLVFLIVSLEVLFSLGPVRTWKAIRSSPDIQFCLLFTIIFGFAVGLTSINFGSLSRYKLPCLPFFGMALILAFYRYNPLAKDIFFFLPGAGKRKRELWRKQQLTRQTSLRRPAPVS